MIPAFKAPADPGVAAAYVASLRVQLARIMMTTKRTYANAAHFSRVSVEANQLAEHNRAKIRLVTVDGRHV